MTDPLRAPWPYFGNKAPIARRVWDALGDPAHYVEPFAGSAAVLLARPHAVAASRLETINDADGMVANAFRAIARFPAVVAEHCDEPVNENELHAKHRWLIGQRESLSKQLEADPDYCDPKAAGWWVWGLCLWIGDGWCGKPYRKLPHLGGTGRGVHSVAVRENLSAVMAALGARMRNVRVASGDWARVLGDATLFSNVGSRKVGVYLDPPYADGEMQYTAGGTGTTLSADVRAWALTAGADPRVRIVLSGYLGEHDSLEQNGWTAVAWKSRGGYSVQDGENANQHRERLWLSPHCLRGDGPLFASL